MKILVQLARHVGTKYHFRVLIHPDKPVEEQHTEAFTYGDDVPLADIRRDFLALMHNKYEEPDETTLAIEGQTFEV